MKETKEKRMTDRERIFMCIIRQLQSTQLLCHRSSIFDQDFSDGRGGTYTHFSRRDPKPGDLVIGVTSLRPHDYMIAWVVNAIQGGLLVREIGSKRTCNYTNEMFYVIEYHGNASDLYEQDEREIYVKVQKAFHRGDEYIYRFGGMEFPESGKVRIWVRAIFGGVLSSGKDQPFLIDMSWTPKTTVKAILQAMRDGGYGTKYSKEPEP